MTSRRITLSLIVSLVVSTGIVASGQTLFFKADNADSLDLGTSWTNNLGIGPGALDTAIWDFNVATAANCTNTVGSPIWGGIRILNPAAPVQVASTGTLTLGGAGQNAIDLSGASQDLWLALSVSTAADQNWVIPAGRTLAVGDASRNVRFQNNVGVVGHLAYLRNLQIQGGGTLFITNSSTLIEPSPGAATFTAVVLLLGNDATVNNVVQTAGTVKLKRTDGTTGNAKTSMQIGGGSGTTAIYTITGGSLQDVSTLNTATFNIGDAANATGTLNVDGTGAVTVGSMRLANAAGAVGTLNLTNGTVTITGNSFDVGRTTGSLPGPGTVNVYGGSLFSTNGMNVPHGQGPGFFNLYGGTVVLGNNLSVPDNSGTGAGTVNINGGTLTLTSGNLNLTGTSASGGPGTVNLNGGVVTVGAVQHPGTASGTLVLNGGTLRARSSQATFIVPAVTANVAAGGAIFDTAGYTVTIPAALLNGTGGGPDGGLTKLGSGTLTLSGANTYTGPTRANAGSLYLFTTNFAGGSLSVSNAALLHVTVGTAGSTLNCSALSLGTLGTSSGGALTLEFDLNGFSNPAVPVVNTPSLAAAGTVGVNVIASGLSEGTYHLIQYAGSVGGSDFVFAANVLGGAVGYVTNNTATHFIDMVITGSPSLVWRAQVNTNWDIGTTANWVDLTNGASTTYPNGAAVYFDDSAISTLVYAVTAVSPTALSINNTAQDYTFTGVGRISGVADLSKQGPGMVTMSLANDYSGNTVISNGTFRLGASGVIPDGTGKGDVTLEGKLDLAGFSEGINGLNGLNGVVDNSAGGAVTLTVGNGGGSGVFAGQITNSTGSLALVKAGGGSLALLGVNSYSGGTTVGGVLQLAYEQSIGTGPLSLGGTLLWTDTAAHTLTNPLTITGGSTFGATTNGLLTVTGTASLGGANRTMTCNSDVLFANGATNGGFSGKAGPGTLTVRNFAGPDWSGGSFGLNNGTLMLDKATAIEHANNIRIQCNVAGGTSRLVLTNGASLTMMDSATSNFRFGDSSNGGMGVTNVVDLAGTLTLTAYPGNNNKFQMGSSSDPMEFNIVNLLPGGVLAARQVTDLSTNISIFNFNGGTLSPNTNDQGVAFMQTLDYCYVQNGGAIIDTAGWDITIGQQLLAGGSGGLTKQGAGTLTLNPDPYSVGLANTYTGDTVVLGGTLALAVYNATAPSKNWVVANGAILDLSGAGGLTLNDGSTLKGTGTVLGFVYVNAGGVVTPGTPVGTLVLEYSPTLNGALQMNVYRSGSTVTSSRLGVINGALNFGGVLTVSNIGGALRTGDTFKLFDAVSYSGAFTQTNLPAGVTWDLSNLYVDGTIKVQNAPAPKNPTFSAPALAGGNLVLTGTGGGVGSPYYVLSSTNMALPLSLWTPILTNVFAADGKFTNSIAIDPAKPALFFDIEVP